MTKIHLHSSVHHGKTLALMEEIIKVNNENIQEFEELKSLFKEMASHLDWCGYGDNWERECARADKLPERVDAMMVKLFPDKK